MGILMEHEEKVARAKEMIERLEKQNEYGQIDQSQVESNHWRIKYLKAIVERPRVIDQPYVRLNPAEELRKNPDFRWFPSSLMKE
ncbi:hypothetical protein [Priestia megaterium]|uniref:hypothetical protein n=1 Tax=Priestia megaterium TaxID=1404 RepID=UPI0035A8A104